MLSHSFQCASISDAKVQLFSYIKKSCTHKLPYVHEKLLCKQKRQLLYIIFWLIAYIARGSYRRKEGNCGGNRRRT